jgi:hypothetical protein
LEPLHARYLLIFATVRYCTLGSLFDWCCHTWAPDVPFFLQLARFRFRHETRLRISRASTFAAGHADARNDNER